MEDSQIEGKINDYRVNFRNGGQIISVEVTCCGGHIGEIPFRDGEHKKCPVCGTLHILKLQHNHFHIRQSKPKIIETEAL
ncbi:hypothetical protein [Desulfosporosinus youngiae]|uniref:Uncharacterized protein n=1 Tax=Desulfosporosinus youngiae DSM 17734 TaxID=768710 RepID=H5Y4K1_9FIRM|nr:hypothetical protein [Desulfosporosinus youngiae]EHQ89599.1 hypothetical protein DesyoDRAFT_2532 [Desulfosporosinus youngiae DSM 17734]